MKMSMLLSLLLLLINISFGIEIWNANRDCPLTCTCQIEHLTETAIYRFLEDNRNKEKTKETNYAEYNEVLNDDSLESELLGDRQIVRSTICILQTETDVQNLTENLPTDLEVLTLIQGHATGSKTVKFSYLEKFENLLSLELLGPNRRLSVSDSNLISEIDTPLPTLRYLNIENVLIRNSKRQIQNFVKNFKENTQTFEYTQQLGSNSHPLTLVRKGRNEEILPYEKYKEQDNEEKIPLFIGFENLHLLRITHCELNSVHWAMFDGLHSLRYLILDHNNLRFIPPFAFYGTSNLKTLSLAHNNLLDIQITDLAGLLELEYLDLSYNNFSQLSELSLPPFPKLKLADFGNNPITIVFPNTFEVMNTTDSLIIGSNDVNLSLMTNSFMGLNQLKALTLNNLNLKILKRDLFVGMPSLTELTLTGNITEIEYDAFLEVYKLKKLILRNCNIKNISMDAFIGLESLELLDLSNNRFEHLPPALFDQLINIKEIYLNNNELRMLPKGIFSKIHAKMIRLNENPWICSCEMSEWKPMIVNRIKQRVIKPCEFSHDKRVGCGQSGHFALRYEYSTKVAPQCAQPEQYVNWNVFQVMRRLLKCPEYKPKIKKHRQSMHQNASSKEIQTPQSKNDLPRNVTLLNKSHRDNLRNDYENNELNALYPMNYQQSENKIYLKNKFRKYKKNLQNINDNII